MPAPFIALSGRRWAGERIHGLPANFASAQIDLHISDYARCVDQAGGVALMVPFEADPDLVMTRMDGLVLSGGADVDPQLYGSSADAVGPTLGDTEPVRDAYEIALFEAAVRAGKPVLAICRGMQLINVALGGTIVADLPHQLPLDLPVGLAPVGHAPVGLSPDTAADQHRAMEDKACSHAAWSQPRHKLLHAVSFDAGSWAAAAFGATSALVNSLHHQSIDRPGSGVVITGRSHDGVVEAMQVEHNGARVFAVQWHPELVEVQPDPCFTWLITEAQKLS